MLRNGGGAIVNIGSTSGKIANRGLHLARLSAGILIAIVPTMTVYGPLRKWIVGAHSGGLEG